MKNFKLLFLTLCLGLISPAGMTSLYAQCPTGTDIHIADDISGSVDSLEFQQSKNFVTEIEASYDNKFGVLDTESRISISNSAGNTCSVENSFLRASQFYTTFCNKFYFEQTFIL